MKITRVKLQTLQNFERKFKQSYRGSWQVWLLLCLVFSCPGVCGGDVTVSEGEDAVLPCSFPEDWNPRLTMRWHIGTTLIFERSFSNSHCGQGYCGRADVPKERFLKGECFLKLFNVARTDSGKYSVHLGNEVQYVELSVEAGKADGQRVKDNAAGSGAPGLTLVIVIVGIVAFLRKKRFGH
ncbi:hypothetical protein KOW79_012714 [Hemibagrus wyckioides]|uniref:Ig-like domain-containing protein n=1 Tax=Hemibagrus wyckioides TaxID=337641 RepID=A0A9D3NKQ0_9TELE|nr:hypothetical protein KOW79_012714 [Hemibagrus wyckioides]